MNNEELNHLAICEQAMKQARWAIDIQLRRWRDRDSVPAVSQLQNAYDSLADLVGDSKMEEPSNPVLKSCNSLEPQAPAMLEALKISNSLLATIHCNLIHGREALHGGKFSTFEILQALDENRAILAAVEGKR